MWKSKVEIRQRVMSKPKSSLDGLSGGSNYNGGGNGNDKNPSTVADKLLAIITPHIAELFEDQVQQSLCSGKD